MSKKKILVNEFFLKFLILDTKKSRTIEFESNRIISMICVSLNNDVITILLVKMKEGKNNERS